MTKPWPGKSPKQTPNLTHRREDQRTIGKRKLPNRAEKGEEGGAKNEPASLPAEGYEMHALQLAREGRTRERKKGKLKREKGSLFRGGPHKGKGEEGEERSSTRRREGSPPSSPSRLRREGRALAPGSERAGRGEREGESANAQRGRTTAKWLEERRKGGERGEPKRERLARSRLGHPTPRKGGAPPAPSSLGGRPREAREETPQGLALC